MKPLKSELCLILIMTFRSSYVFSDESHCIRVPRWNRSRGISTATHPCLCAQFLSAPCPRNWSLWRHMSTVQNWLASLNFFVSFAKYLASLFQVWLGTYKTFPDMVAVQVYCLYFASMALLMKSLIVNTPRQYEGVNNMTVAYSRPTPTIITVLLWSRINNHCPSWRESVGTTLAIQLFIKFKSLTRRSALLAVWTPQLSMGRRVLAQQMSGVGRNMAIAHENTHYFLANPRGKDTRRPLFITAREVTIELAIPFLKIPKPSSVLFFTRRTATLGTENWLCYERYFLKTG